MTNSTTALNATIESLAQENKKLVENNKQLTDALKEITEMALNWSVKGLTPTIHKAQRVILEAGIK